ncbi:MAG: CHAP domain-containing protein [Hyphomicrobiales bacterium]
MRLKTAFQDELIFDFDRLLIGADDAFEKRFVNTVTEWLELWIVYSGEFIVPDEDKTYARVAFQPKVFGRRTCRAAEAFLTFWRKGEPHPGSDFGEMGLRFANGEIAIESADLGRLKESLTVLWNNMTQPMRRAFEAGCYPQFGDKLARRVSAYALQFDSWRPYEIPNNQGPWVRSFMDGHSGQPWAWCMGFAQTAFDSAAFDLGLQFTQFMKPSFTVEQVRQDARDRGTLKTLEDIKGEKYSPKPGDFFMVIFSNNEAHHTGIVTAAYQDRILTVEGNTNMLGSSAGIGVFRRVRDIRENIEFVEIPETG